MAAAKKEKKPIKTGTSSRHITNLKQSILETFGIYGGMSHSYRETNLQPLLGTAEICQLFYSAANNVTIHSIQSGFK
jgi:hypothetical protein